MSSGNFWFTSMEAVEKPLSVFQQPASRAMGSSGFFSFASKIHASMFFLRRKKKMNYLAKRFIMSRQFLAA